MLILCLDTQVREGSVLVLYGVTWKEMYRIQGQQNFQETEQIRGGYLCGRKGEEEEGKAGQVPIEG
jgi:hypothetical protein